MLGWQRFRDWFGARRQANLGRLTFYFYTRPGCHLCAEAWALLQREQCRWGFELVYVDVDGDPELRARHGEQVPVVELDGKVRFRGGVPAVLLRRLLDAEARRPRP